MVKVNLFQDKYFSSYWVPGTNLGTSKAMLIKKGKVCALRVTVFLGKMGDKHESMIVDGNKFYEGNKKNVLGTNGGKKLPPKNQGALRW
jgi:hypothetical protein